MIKFEFMLEDEDAEVLFGCISDAVGRADEYSKEKLLSLPEREWFKKHASYLKELMKKCTI